MSGKNFYITTPIYYANDRPHIGHAYTTILTDVLTRYHRLLGFDTFFLTGTDEHGQKVQQAAEKRGITPREQVDEFHQRFKELWKTFNISHDRFIRTTDEDHVAFVRKAVAELHERDEVYMKEYEGWYSVSQEQYFAEDDVDAETKTDKEFGKPVEWIKEKNYFFRMSKYQERLIQHIQDNPEFIQPEHRKNEILGFLKKPLQDLCISRPKTRLSWGISIPFDEEFVLYVWVDALLNYQTAVDGFKFPDGSEAWPADYHIIGKDILTTHCVYWPTLLMALDRPLPKKILAHGWWLNKGGGKISKSDPGSIVYLEDYVEAVGVDAVRYFLVRDMVLGSDSAFSDELFIARINSELANDLGNGINRVNKFVLSKFDGRMPVPGSANEQDQALQALAEDACAKALENIRAVKPGAALEEVARLVRGVNKYLEDRAPWNLAKDPEQAKDGTELASVLCTAGEALRIALAFLHPVMPTKTLDGLAMLGAGGNAPTLDGLKWGVLKGGESLEKRPALFPRIEIRDENDPKQNKQAQGGKQGKQKPNQQGAADPAAKLDLRVARITAVENHPEADALFKLTVDDGEGERTVCAGLRSSYEAGDLENRAVVLLANLKPAKLRGVESRGMLLAADLPDGDKAALLDPGELAVGTQLQFGDIAPAPKSKLGTKDLDKVPMSAKGGRAITGEDKAMNAGGVFIKCEAPDGAKVR